MGKLSQHIREADFKSEKHVPVLECPDRVKAGEWFEITASVGREIPHPNTTEHHIRWIALYFHPDGENQVFEIGRHEFNSHGESVQGANQGPVYTHSSVKTQVQIKKSGMLHALAYCNIHGLWESGCNIQAV